MLPMQNAIKLSKLGLCKICMPLAAVLFTGAALAGEVELVSHDESLRFTGELVAVEGSHYVITTAIGEVRVPIVNVICIGESCPEDEAEDDEAEEIEYTVNMAASAGIADQLLPVIALGAAEALQASVIALDTEGEPLPDHIGRPWPNGPREDDDDDDDEGGHDDDDDDDDEGEADIISILMVNDEGETVLSYGVWIEEEDGAVDMLADNEVDIIFLDEPAEADDIEEVRRGRWW